MTTVKMERKALAHALRVLTGVTPRKGNIPALLNVKLSANGDVKLSATDLEYGAVASIPRVGGRGDATLSLPAARFAGMVRAGASEFVELKTDKGFAVTLDGAATLIGGDPADFPALPALDDGELIARMDAAILAEGYRMTDHAVSTEVVRYALTGVLLDLDVTPRKAVMVSSDGKRLMSWQLRNVTVKTAARMILPCSALKALANLAGKSGETVEIRKPKGGDCRAYLRVGNGGVFTRLIDGHFPDYEAVTPANLPEPWTVNLAQLRAALAAVTMATTDKTRAVRFTFKPGRVELFTRTADVGEARATAECTLKGAPVEVVLNPDYVLDYLNALPKALEHVGVAVKDKTCATLWQSMRHDKYVLMPLTINL